MTATDIKKIDVCIGNFDHGIEDVIEKLKAEFPNLKGQRWGCLGNCGNCYRKPFVMANNRFLVEADTPEDLYQKLQPNIKTDE